MQKLVPINSACIIGVAGLIQRTCSTIRHSNAVGLDTIPSVQTDAQQYSMHSRSWCKMNKHKEHIRWSKIAGFIRTG